MIKYILLATVLILAGCADSHTTGQEKDLDIRTTITINQMEGNTGSVTITPGIDYASAAGDTTQDTANTAETPTEIDLNLRDLNNPVSTMTEVLERKADTKIIKRAEEIAEDNDDAVTQSKVYEMHERYDDGRPFYRLGIPGEQFGKTVLFKDDKGNEFLIPDTSVDTGDRAQQFFFTGKGETKTFDGNASLFWFKDGSEKVTAYYNGVEK